ncbi:hypothetical protein [Methylotuvimicrobium sp.]|uniref:hypothetical protein n=1 Tax=Methylotuvimicrobium sp. TaxID=2822413 RepID=UPI003D65405F
MEPLIHRPNDTCQDALEDLFMCMAATIEDSLMQSGAKPGVDYSYLDLYKLASPFVLHTYKLPEANIHYRCSWPHYYDK